MAGGDFKNLGKDARKRGNQVTIGLNNAVKRLVLAIDAELVVSTPVDTGRARSNWIVTLSEPTDDVADAYVPGEQGSTAGQNTTAALAQARVSISDRYPEQPVFINNNLPYVEYLNEGSSAQAPAGFIEAALQNGQTVFNNMKVFDDEANQDGN